MIESYFLNDPPHQGLIFSEMPWKEDLQLLFRNYWRRLWIIQEIALNHNMTLFLCGKRQLSRKMIWRASTLLIRDAEMVDKLIAKKFGIVNNIPGLIHG